MPTELGTKTNVVAFAKQLIAGVDKHLTGATPVTLRGSAITPAQITGQLQALVTLRADVEAAKAVTKAKIAAEQAGAPAPRALMSALVLYVKGAYGNSPDVLADFGIVPKLREAPTIEMKAASSAKRAATRAARHTMGAVQKRGVRGAVTGIVVTPIVAGAPVVTGPSPVASAPAGSPVAAVAPVATTHTA